VTRAVLASANPGKLREFAALLAPLAVALVPQAQLGVRPAAETGTTFLENALIKAHHAARHARLPALADDSGLEVDALGGRYQCVIVWVRSVGDQSPLIAHGTWEGSIARAPRGQRGFGYDPVFVPAGEHRSAAQLASAEKNAVSHRGQALRALVAMLESGGYIRTP